MSLLAAMTITAMVTVHPAARTVIFTLMQAGIFKVKFFKNFDSIYLNVNFVTFFYCFCEIIISIEKTLS